MPSSWGEETIVVQKTSWKQLTPNGDPLTDMTNWSSLEQTLGRKCAACEKYFWLKPNILGFAPRPTSLAPYGEDIVWPSPSLGEDIVGESHQARPWQKEANHPLLTQQTKGSFHNTGSNEKWGSISHSRNVQSSKKKQQKKNRQVDKWVSSLRLRL